VTFDLDFMHMYGLWL